MEICIHCFRQVENKFQYCPYCKKGYIEAQPQVYHLPQRTILNERYIIGPVLGFGGFGITYKAWDINLRTAVAIKEYYPVGSVNRIPGQYEVKPYSDQGKKVMEKGKTDFLEEARNTANFSKHPNIVSVYNYFEENGTAYFVMEYLDGISLKEYVKRNNGRIDADTVILIAKEILSALALIHSEGILHRDISPDNIFINGNGVVKLIDFGAARFSSSEEETRSVILKPGYAPPEQYETKSKQGPWTDLYALGACLYRVITGAVPEESVNRVEDVRKGKDGLRPPGELVDDIPPYLERIILKAMAIQPELRFQNAGEMLYAIENEKKVLTVKEELKKRKFRRFAFIIGGLLVLAIGGLGFHNLYNYKKNLNELETARVSVWLSYEKNEDENEKKAILEEALREYQETYPNIMIDLKLIPEGEYKSQLKAAFKKAEGPVLFESDMLPDNAGWMENLTDLTKDLKREDYIYLPEDKYVYRFPVGVESTIFYVNTNEWKEKFPIRNSYNDFMKGRSSVLIDGVGNYLNIQKELSGNYKIANNILKEAYIWPSDYWSVNAEASKEEIKAAKRIIYYLLGENAQNALYLTDLHAFPNRRSILDIMGNIYPELVETIGSMEQRELVSDSEKICDSIFEDASKRTQIIYDLNRIIRMDK